MDFPRQNSCAPVSSPSPPLINGGEGRGEVALISSTLGSASEHATVRASVASKPFNNPPKIPTGFRLKAQGCAARATLGAHPKTIFNRNAVAATLLSHLKPEQPSRSAQSNTLEPIPPLLGGEGRGEGERCPQTIEQPSKNPNGIPAQSPGLRGTSYPGYPAPTIFNRNAVAASRCSLSKREQPSRPAMSKRWNPFPLSPGERAGVRASVNPFSPQPN